MEITTHSFFSGDPFFMRIILTIVMLYLAASFIQIIIKLLLDQQLKRRMIDRGLTEETIRLILAGGTHSLGETALKWSLIFGGIAGGLVIIGLTRPNEMYSLAIIAAGIALAFLAYYFIKRRQQPHA